ncbi:hypothetical protein I4U23_005327 [Adineta vaga]|nr:hypothetical protein I4U23_005327 [Adineta vaga]
MERISITDENLTNIPKTSLFEIYHQYVIPALTKKIYVGAQLSLFSKAKIKENHGHEPLFYNWRSKIIKYNGFNPNFIPRKHYIIITNKSIFV